MTDYAIVLLMVVRMRLLVAPASTLADVGCHNEKARPLSAWLRQAIRAVVSLSDKATGVSVGAPAPVITSTHPGKRTTSKLAILLSRRRPVRSIGATHERSSLRSASPNHRSIN